MLEELKKLVDKLTGDEKSKALAEIKRLEKLSLVSKPKDLDALFKDKEFAGFENQFDSKVGTTRTKWESDQKEKEEKLKEAAKPETKTEQSETEKALSAKLDELTKSIASLATSKNVDDLKVYAAEKVKDLPKEFQGLINVTEHTTQAEIDKQVEQITTAHGEIIKNIDQTPNQGTITGPTDVEFETQLEDFGKQIEETTK